MSENTEPNPEVVQNDIETEDSKTASQQPQLSATQLQEIQKLLMGGAPSSDITNVTKSFCQWGSFPAELGSKNREIYCPRCPSKISLSDTAVLVNKEMSMSKYKVDGPTEEVIDTFYQLGSLMSFENIGVTKLVNNIKFLSCADCEVGPLGWHDITDNTKFYVAAGRVRYLDE